MTTEPAPAKINLALHVRRRRADGYHDLETLFAFCADGDIVTVAPAERDSFAITGPFAADLGRPHPHPSHSPQASGKGEGEWAENLVTRAADSFRETFATTTPYAITLDKRLPVASGIGGGSADAAATLRGLARLHGIDRRDDRLFAIAARLGADVPACLLGRTAFATGRGDDLTPLDALGDVPVLLVNPGVGVSTAAVFGQWDGVDRGGIAGEGTPLARAAAGRNDLMPSASALVPVIGTVLDHLHAAPGTTLVRMSGSGATCFALFDGLNARDAAAEGARSRGRWTLATTLV
ncbi:4-(cytidine 5'-diphospho)-2-C-methyl-D-erythritol kinase [Sphingomonas sp.]|uniref:4-(cytidine 5'-diphospho)-2-C-methyl-D-erythritol kinase n=1 Tax=Sphingomonas sp. TaxID=28214 RepID=UPI002ED9D378